MMEALEETELCFPQLPNSSCRIPIRSYSVSLLTYILLSSISLLTVILNLLVIISISHFKQLHTPTNLLLLSLSASDFFIGLLLVFQIMLIDGCWYLGDLMCDLYYVMGCIATSASIGNMVLISIDRHWAICYPLHYPSKVTQTRVKVCVCVLWICSAVISSLGVDLEHPGRYNSCAGECVFGIDYFAGGVVLFFFFIGPITVIIVLYMRVFVVAVTQARAMRSHTVMVKLQGSVSVTAKKPEMKAARTLGVVIVIFLICLCPYFCVSLEGQDTLLNTSSSNFVICLFYFNSCLNPVIYAFFYPWFRKSVKLIFTLEIFQPDSCENNIT